MGPGSKESLYDANIPKDGGNVNPKDGSNGTPPDDIDTEWKAKGKEYGTYDKANTPVYDTAKMEGRITKPKTGRAKESKYGWFDANGYRDRVAYIEDRNGNIFEATISIAVADNGKKHIYSVGTQKIDVSVNDIKNSKPDIARDSAIESGHQPNAVSKDNVSQTSEEVNQGIRYGENGGSYNIKASSQYPSIFSLPFSS